jgi:type I restriction enzyme S subunit
MAEWKPIDELFDYEKGTLQSSKCTSGSYTFITAAEDWKTHETFTHDCEALIFAMAASGSLGRTHYFKGKFISSDLCFILTPRKGLRLDLIFYYRLFNFLRTDIVKKTSTGTSKLAINQTNFGAYKLPYFDYEHQLSFRGKIETITGINEEFVEGIGYQLSLLTKLRQAVLQEAIEGKLTAAWRKQNPKLISGENHASKLLEKIKIEKGRLIKEGKIKKEKPLLPIINGEKPFELPDGWVWCRLGEVVKEFQNGLSKRNGTSGNPVIVVRLADIDNYKLSLLNSRQIKLTSSEFEKYSLMDFDILITRVNGSVDIVGNFNLIRNCNDQVTYCDHFVRMSLFFPEHFAPFFFYVEKTSLIRNRIKDEFKTTSGQKTINQGQLNNFYFPIPPLAEQQAIVERVDKLVAMIDVLEKQVSERKKQSEMLMRSVLREAFI